ncbi:hypothetical protein GC56T3_2658 [Geobacillus sp. C56-T3]|nr:hypothetical protein GC56T3_2658 [Geobacillus sp. C56-T3]
MKIRYSAEKQQAGTSNLLLFPLRHDADPVGHFAYLNRLDYFVLFLINDAHGVVEHTCNENILVIRACDDLMCSVSCFNCGHALFCF